MSFAVPSRLRPWRALLQLLAVLALAGAASGCSDSSDRTAPEALDEHPELPSVRSTRSDLDEARTRWAAGAPRRYRFAEQIGCFCIPEVTREVRVVVRRDAAPGGEVVESVRYLDDDTPAAPGYVDELRTVEGLFALIENAFDQNADDVRVTFDPTLGYPRAIAIDYRAGWADDELWIRARNLTEVP